MCISHMWRTHYWEICLATIVIEVHIGCFCFSIFLCDVKSLCLFNQEICTCFWSLIQECAAAFVLFKSRYAALTVAQNRQTANPMLWVTDFAPEPRDVYWSNLCIPYRQLWIRKISIFVASITFVLVFLIPVTFAQGLTQLDKLEKTFPFLAGTLQK